MSLLAGMAMSQHAEDGVRLRSEVRVTNWAGGGLGLYQRLPALPPQPHKSRAAPSISMKKRGAVQARATALAASVTREVGGDGEIHGICVGQPQHTLVPTNSACITFPKILSNEPQWNTACGCAFTSKISTLADVIAQTLQDTTICTGKNGREMDWTFETTVSVLLAEHKSQMASSASMYPAEAKHMP